MRIAVLLGGDSDERDVSLASGVQVAAALREASHVVTAVDPAMGVLPVGEEKRILERGVMPRPPTGDRRNGLADLGSFLRSPEVGAVDAVFVALHGGSGEDGTVQGVLESIGIPFTGSDRLGCALAMDKDVSKRLLRDAGVPTPEWSAGEVNDSITARLGFPIVVKAANGGSSLRLVIAHDPSELAAAVEEARAFDDLAIYERFVPGREFTVGVVGDEALPVGEIIPENEIFDYECKYQPGMAREIFPAEITEVMAVTLQELARKVHRVLRMRDYSRVDFVVDSDGTAWCLEGNALPGMTGNSLLPKAAQAAGITFPELCDRIVALAVQR